MTKTKRIDNSKLKFVRAIAVNRQIESEPRSAKDEIANVEFRGDPSRGGIDTDLIEPLNERNEENTEIIEENCVDDSGDYSQEINEESKSAEKDNTIDDTFNPIDELDLVTTPDFTQYRWWNADLELENREKEQIIRKKEEQINLLKEELRRVKDQQ